MHDQSKIISDMFSRIAKRYDLANDLLSLGTHRLWKKKALRLLNLQPNDRFLDLCCGTGDFLIQAHQRYSIGADLSHTMLKEAHKRNSHLPLICADGETLPFHNTSFDKVIIGFGIRNIPQTVKALQEIHRVLKPDGKLVILEFSKPRSKFFSKIYLFYLNKILPIIGGWLSKDKSAYEYLAQTIQSFPDGEDFLKLMGTSGFEKVNDTRLNFGIASIYEGKKYQAIH